MNAVYYILTIFLSDVLCANIKNKEEPLKWSDIKLKFSSYNHLIEYGEESKCFEPDDIHFNSLLQATALGIESAILQNLNDLKNVSEFVNHQKSFKINQTKFCESLHDKIPKNYSFIKFTGDSETCLTTCFCKISFLENNTPDKGCVLLDYIYTKINTDFVGTILTANATQSVNKMEIIKEPQNQVLQQSPKIETTRILEDLKPKPKETKKLKQATFLQQVKDKKPENSADFKLEVNTSKSEIEETTEEKKTIEIADQNFNIPTNENDINGFLKTEKSIEQDKNNDMDDSYDEENLNLDNNPKVEQSQFNVNENEYPRQIISTVQEDRGSNFFTYLLLGMFLTILFYIIYHNKTKILALILEGRRSKSGRGRRKHTASYSKLDSNLEEAISSPYSGRSSQIIY